MKERWVPTLSYELVRTGDTYSIYKRGGIHVRDHIPDEEVALRFYATAVDYDAAVVVLRALRAAIRQASDHPDGET